MKSPKDSPKKEEKIIINQKLDNEISLYEETLNSTYTKSTNNYLLCPFCVKSIPLIIPFINTKTSQINLYLSCKCIENQLIPIETLLNIDTTNKKTKTPNQFCEICKSNLNFENILYCLFCNKWICESCRNISFENEEKIHLYIDNEINFQDFCVHNEIFINNLFCVDCEKSICSYCKKKKHKTHMVIKMEEYYKQTEEKLQKLYNENVENNEKFDESKFFDFIYNNIMNVKNCKLNYEKILAIKNDDNNNDKNDLNELIDNNLKINLQIFYLTKYIYEKFKLSKGFMNNNFIINMNTILNFNFNKFDFPLKNNNNNNVNEFIYNFSNFLSNNYIIKINNLIYFEALQKESSALEDEDEVNNFLRLSNYLYIFLSNNLLMYYDLKKNSISNYIYNENEEDDLMTQLLIPKQRSMSNSYKNIKDREIQKEKNTLKINFVIKINDNKLALAVGKIIKIYNAIELLLNPEYSLKEHKKNINFLYAIKDEKLISSSVDFEVKIWDLKKKKCIYNFDREFFSLKESIKENNLYYFGTKNGILTLDITKGNSSHSICHKNNVTCLTMKDNFLISGSKDQYIKKLIIKSNNFEENKTIFLDKSIRSLTEINDKFFGVIVDETGLIFIDYKKLTKINYIDLLNEKIMFFSALGNGYFFGITDKKKYKIIKGNNNISKNNKKIIFS